MPEEVKEEICPWFIERQAIVDDAAEKIIKLDDNAAYVDSDLKVDRFLSLASKNSEKLIFQQTFMISLS